MYIMVLAWFLADQPSKWIQVEQPSVEAACELAVGCLDGGAGAAAIVLKRSREEHGGFNLANVTSIDILREVRDELSQEHYRRFVDGLRRSYEDLTHIHRLEVR